MSKLVLSGDALADASVLGAFLLNAKNARRDTAVGGRAERDAGGGGGGGGHLSAESTASSASPSAQTAAKWVSGARRRMVRRPNLPFVPRRGTVADHYHVWLVTARSLVWLFSSLLSFGWSCSRTRALMR